MTKSPGACFCPLCAATRVHRPPDLYDIYDPDELPMPPQWRAEDWPDHPAMDYFRRFFTFDPQFAEPIVRQAERGYYAVCTYLDRQIGRVLDSLDELELTHNTRVIYTSDHGEHLGGRGIYGKFTMYEDAAAVPFLVAGQRCPPAKWWQPRVAHRQFSDNCGSRGRAANRRRRGFAGRIPVGYRPRRKPRPHGLCEYHAVGAKHGAYMLRNLQYKYIYYVNAPPQLFDATTDPDECDDLAPLPDSRDALEILEYELREIVDPRSRGCPSQSRAKSHHRRLGWQRSRNSTRAFDNSPVPGEAPKFGNTAKKNRNPRQSAQA